jgi:hypothetical protein
MAEKREKGMGQSHEPGKREEETDAGDHGQRQTDDPGFVLAVPWKFSAQDGDKNDIIDPENNFEPRERRKGDPRLRFRDPGHKASLL